MYSLFPKVIGRDMDFYDKFERNKRFNFFSKPLVISAIFKLNTNLKALFFEVSTKRTCKLTCRAIGAHNCNGKGGHTR
ncbi:hypothetical protein J437_LFUL008843 [Ladona fulva]|uniref:Uncharacterized protein n=1 Tax=Ladona fulva TaxID=123851 RepID=A0A8K0K9A7_LADFU|nr:hypothetical protein J437_LFUL008843 [Ladona fulva]